jgi:hypothetical protein
MSFCFYVVSFTVSANVLALGEEADFEALNCQPSSKVDTRQNVQLTTEPAFLPNACYAVGFLFLSSVSLIF